MQYLFSPYHIYQAKSNKCIISTKGMITTDLCPDNLNSYLLVLTWTCTEDYIHVYTCQLYTLGKPADLKL